MPSSSPPPTEADFAAAGLYDPADPVAPERLELLRWLAAMDFGIEEMVQAATMDSGNLTALAGDRRILPGRRLTRAEAVERSGLSPEEFDAYATGLGFVPVVGAAPGELGLTVAEVDAMRLIGELAPMFSAEEATGFVRVLGASVGRIADAAVALFLIDVEGRHLEAGESELGLAEKVYEAVGLLDGFTAHLDPVLRRHVLQSIERTRMASVGDQRLRYRFAIGFVDLVGFTELATDMTPQQLTAFVRDFEARALDITTTAGGRVVKLIGDEVMFVAADPDAACRVAAALMQGMAGEHVAVRPRGGLAFGDVLVRAGDYYGPVVNLASRIVDEAMPDEVLVSIELADAATRYTFEPAGRRMVKGFDQPITVRSLVLTSA